MKRCRCRNSPGQAPDTGVFTAFLIKVMVHLEFPRSDPSSHPWDKRNKIISNASLNISYKIRKFKCSFQIKPKIQRKMLSSLLFLPHNKKKLEYYTDKFKLLHCLSISARLHLQLNRDNSYVTHSSIRFELGGVACCPTLYHCQTWYPPPLWHLV